MEKALVNQTNILRTLPQSLKVAVLMVLGSMIIAVSAKIQIPFWPVPMTMQTFVVMMIAMGFGWKLGGATMLLYLFEGAVGLPVFASGGGIAYLTGPTAGYLYGMLFASLVISYLANIGFSKTYFKSLISLTIGSIIIFSIGIIYLGSIIGYQKAVAVGLLPFIPSELFKVALAVALIPTIQKVIKK